MDAIALLCTLHADGPSTLKRLRQAGCTTLDSLCALDDTRLASMLATTPASARRLQREAELLRERLGGDHSATKHDDSSARGSNAAPAPRPELSTTVGQPRATRAPHPHDVVERESRSAESPGESVPLTGVELEARERRLMARVLETWRVRDETDDGEPNTSAPALSSAPAPAASLERRGSPLREHALDGLDASLCAALLGRGIQTLEELAACDPVDLVRDLPVGYSRLARLTALARRELARTGTGAPNPTSAPASTAHPAVKFSRAELPFAVSAKLVAAELSEGLKTPPTATPKDGPAGITDTGREGAGGPFV